MNPRLHVWKCEEITVTAGLCPPDHFSDLEVACEATLQRSHFAFDNSRANGTWGYVWNFFEVSISGCVNLYLQEDQHSIGGGGAVISWLPN